MSFIPKGEFLNKNFNFTITAPKANVFQEDEFNVITWVMNGQITNLNNFFQMKSKDFDYDISRIANIQDDSGRSLLFYAWLKEKLFFKRTFLKEIINIIKKATTTIAISCSTCFGKELTLIK